MRIAKLNPRTRQFIEIYNIGNYIFADQWSGTPGAAGPFTSGSAGPVVVTPLVVAVDDVVEQCIQTENQYKGANSENYYYSLATSVFNQRQL